MNIVEVNNLNKIFNNEYVLKNVTISFESNKIHGIIGRNGSGKTMLLKSICGFVPPTSGEVIVNTKKIGKDVDFPPNTGIIIETPGFLPNYSGLKNLEVLASINRKISRQNITDVMIQVGLNPKSKKHVSKYSLGMKQRLGIAQAIMEDPNLILFDEPMNGLDTEGVQEVRKLLFDLKSKGKTILLASHNMDDINQLCDTLCKMEKGELEILSIYQV